MWACVGLCSSLALFPSIPVHAQPVLSSCVHQDEPIRCTQLSLQEAFQHALTDITVEGTLVFSLTIDSSGRLKAVELLRDLDPPLGDRAIRIFDQLPDWAPIAFQGQVQEATFTLPVTLEPAHPGSGYQVSWGNAQGEGISRSDLDQLAMEPVLILDLSGHTLPPAEVVFTYQRGSRTKTWRSPSRLTSSTRKVLKRCRVGGTLTLIAFVQQGTRFQEVMRSWTILP